MQSNKVGGYPSFNVVFSISVALFLIGLFLLVSFYISGLTGLLRSNFKVQVFITDSYDVNRMQEISDEIEKLDFVRYQNGEPMIGFVHRDSLAAQFIERTGEDFYDVLEGNPLKHKFDVTILDKEYEESELDSIQATLERIDGVFEAEIPVKQIKEISGNIGWITWSIIALVAIILVLVFFLVDNAIKLALFSQRFIIRSMQLLGAEDNVIKRPFLLKSIKHGLISTAIAYLLILALHLLVVFQLAEIGQTMGIIGLAIILIALAILGISISFASTNLSLNRYLKMELDQLFR